jgi:anthranilate synthase component 1
MLLDRFPDQAEFLRLADTANVIPVGFEYLADTLTPVSLLAGFGGGPRPLFLLESVEGGERWGRYSFLGTAAHSRLQVFPRHLTVTGNGSPQTIPHDGRPLPALRAYMAAFRPAACPGLPRFWGGMVGYLTYEFVSFLESIPHRWPEDRPLATFVIPDEILIFDNIRHTLTGLVLAFTDSHPEGAAGAYAQAHRRCEDLLERLAAGPCPPVPAPAADIAYSLHPTEEAEDFRQAVARVKTHIRAGDIIQAVISQPFVCPRAPDPWSLYRAQRYVNPSPYLFFLGLDDLTLVGSSPETMVRLENGVATLRPIAGTRPRGRGEAEDRRLASELLEDEKERAEHLMLVDLGRNDLGRVAETGSVQVSDLMVVERYSHVMHLVSNITCDLRPDLDAWDLLAATFPAGTLSGAPKIRAMEIIHALEHEPRGPYGGAVGYFAFNGNMDLAITIRTAVIQDQHLVVRAGAGIVADSDPERERLETVNKAKAIERALQILSRGDTRGGLV